jgi:hypothetical protein
MPRPPRALPWPVFVLAWLLAVAVTALVGWRAVHFVGNQLATGISLPPSGTAASFPPLPAPSPSRRPTPAGGPPDAGIGTPISITSPDPVPHVVPEPGPGITTGASPPGAPKPSPARPAPHPSPAATGRSDPPQPTPAPPTPAPPPASSPAAFSDQRRVSTAGGTASFGCSPANDLALIDVAPAAGYRQRPTTAREPGHLIVFFVSERAETKIEAHCSSGRVLYTVEN